ncbi:E3 ubiquitin-protein ligase Bre1 [Aspergillus luchuensis]|uniref:E3 ubiquitin-protein ligase Bre1 n=1 Tax=Aspergillus kawachii TaxID=1069201 RepID=A0A146FFG8_ASPKA|nr:E3 ubiquitin-protein ligase Bre1 [Aspergillus luchuensis]
MGPDRTLDLVRKLIASAFQRRPRTVPDGKWIKTYSRLVA